MFRHVVMFTWNDTATEDAKAAIRDGLNRLATMDAVSAYLHGPDAGVSEGNWDYVVVGDFETVEHYRTYASDESHLELIAQHIKPNISGRAAVQYHL